MEATVFYLLMLQKYINSKQKILKKKYPYVQEIFQEIFQVTTPKKKKKKPGLNVCVYNISVDYRDYRAFDTSNIIDIHKYLMKKRDIK